MPTNPLDDLCEAIRALPPMTGVQALNELLRANVINFNDAMECGRALTMLRVLAEKRDAWKKRQPSN